MDVKTIVSNYLKANSFEGLFSDGECACELSDLMPCCEDCSDHDTHRLSVFTDVLKCVKNHITIQ
jgi:hypothetical protein